MFLHDANRHDLQSDGDAMNSVKKSRDKENMGFKALFTPALLIALSGCGVDSDYIVTELFPSRSDAEKSELMSNGWLPRSLPLSADNILITYKIDSAEIWLRFSHKEDIDSFLGSCIQQNPALPSLRRTRSIASWWPRELTAGNDIGAGFVAYSCEEMPHGDLGKRATVILDVEDRTVWYWSA